MNRTIFNPGFTISFSIKFRQFFGNLTTGKKMFWIVKITIVGLQSFNNITQQFSTLSDHGGVMHSMPAIFALLAIEDYGSKNYNQIIRNRSGNILIKLLNIFN